MTQDELTQDERGVGKSLIHDVFIPKPDDPWQADEQAFLQHLANLSGHPLSPSQKDMYLGEDQPKKRVKLNKKERR